MKIKTLLLTSISTNILLFSPEITLANNVEKQFSPELQNKNSLLKEIVVTANPLEKNSNQFARPVKILKDKELQQKTRATLGETLNKELGVNSTFYGQGASRPVIRGLEGDNIAILQNGIANIDASATSVDHNIAIDPYSAEKIEIIRGPQALFYGTKAIGGVINIIDNRIPEEQSSKLITGEVSSQYNSADRERSGRIKLKSGDINSGINYNFSGFTRDTDNYDINGFARSGSKRFSEPLTPPDTEVSNKLINSQTDAVGGNLGLSKIYDDGFIGVSYSGLNNNYGIPPEYADDVNIRLKSRRVDFSGENENLNDKIKKVTYKLGFTDYNHSEYEGTSPETTFKNNGYDGRVEFTHAPINGFQGAFGIQSFGLNASTIGDEPLLPITDTLTNSAFLYEELPFDEYMLMFGGRADHQTVESSGGGNFGAASDRSDTTFSGSTGIKYYLSDEYSSTLNLSYTERAPNHQELFSNGPHEATGTFEVGDINLDIQRSYGVDISLNKDAGDITGALNLFYNRFQDYIFLNQTGLTDGGSGFDIYNFTGTPAEFFGFETEIGRNLYQNGSQKLDGKIHFDYVQAENTRTNQPLPHISPMRLGSRLTHTYSKLTTTLNTTYTFEQNETPANEASTDGFTMVDMGFDYEIDNSENPASLYLQGTNLLNEEARNHISFIKDEVPLPGRSVMVGVKIGF